MKKIKAFCRNIRKGLIKGDGIYSSDLFELLELIVNHLETPNTINIKKLVETINVNTSNLKEGMNESKKIITEALLSALNDIKISPQQYRIGNYFRYDEEICIVHKIEDTQINGIDLKHIRPILVNSTKLEDLGFNEDAMDIFKITLGEKGLVYFPNEGYVSISNKGSYRHTYDNIKYIHQIQNVYFDFMNEVLKFR